MNDNLPLRPADDTDFIAEYPEFTYKFLYAVATQPFDSVRGWKQFIDTLFSHTYLPGVWEFRLCHYCRKRDLILPAPRVQDHFQLTDNGRIVLAALEAKIEQSLTSD